MDIDNFGWEVGEKLLCWDLSSSGIWKNITPERYLKNLPLDEWIKGRA